MAATPDAEMVAFLGHHRVEKYQQGLCAGGIVTFNQLLACTEHDLKDLVRTTCTPSARETTFSPPCQLQGILKGARVKMLHNARNWRRPAPTDQVAAQQAAVMRGLRVADLLQHELAQQPPPTAQVRAAADLEPEPEPGPDHSSHWGASQLLDISSGISVGGASAVANNTAEEALFCVECNNSFPPKDGKADGEGLWFCRWCWDTFEKEQGHKGPAPAGGTSAGPAGASAGGAAILSMLQQVFPAHQDSGTTAPTATGARGPSLPAHVCRTLTSEWRLRRGALYV